ncbi:VOC family protein [Nocardioides sp. cx-169]|uniref:VOC family protein n=1 Tax=Nocardioides sp. cx-169 TaxID=2899080 RepID=UPI001E4F5F43|nr:VOC family protein [Nocardioides sp. cx-169]MCD4536400.1 VOC family protein [Nocardioides sp. cx-169]
MTWLTAFLDLPADEVDGATAFWAGVTGYAVSPPRGPFDEFVSLVPPDGDVHLKLQRLGEGPRRLHLDVHVPDPDQAAVRAERLGATALHRSEHGYVVLSSPGGLTHCLVGHDAARPAPPADWGAHRSAVDQVCLDVPPSAYVRETEFWTAITGWAFEPHENEEFDSLARPSGAPLRVLFQKLADEQEQVSAHLDLSTTDRAAETTRHEALGALAVSIRGQWTVLQPPAGGVYCITDRTP